MTIQEILNKNDINFTVEYKEKGLLLLKISDYCVLIWLNESSSFKMKRKTLEKMISISGKHIFFLVDKSTNKYFFMKFAKANNWLTAGFYNCDKDELFLGKQILNSRKSLADIVNELKKL